MHRDDIEEQLRQNSVLLRMAGHMARFGGWAYYVNEQRLVLTDETAAIHDLPPGTLLTLDEAIDFHAPEYRRTIRELFTRCLDEGASYVTETQLVTAKGRRIWARSLGTAVRDADGSIVRVQGAMQDITPLKTQEERLARTADRITTTLESITDAFFMLDREWRFTYVNREAERLVGKQRAEMLGHTLWEEFPEAVDSEFDRQYRLALSEHRPVQFETLYPPLGIWLEVHAYPSDEGLAIYFRDVTERRKAEAALRKSEKSLRLAMTASGLGTWHLNTATGDVELSEQASEMLGFPSARSLTATDLIQAIHPGDRGSTIARAERAIARGKDFRADFRVVRPDGAIRWLAALGHAYSEEGGQGIRLEGVNMDITERKSAERDLLDANERLETAREQLSLFARRLDSGIEQERRRLARDVHDELGQVFTGLMLVMSGVAARHGLAAQDTAEINALLDEGVSTARRIAGELRPPLLDDLGLGAALEHRAARFSRETGIDCSVDVADGDLLSREQALQLFRIVQEALTNAARHSAPRSVRISGAPHGDGYRLEVQDDGRGLVALPRGTGGVTSMRERATLAGGRLAIEGAEGSGVRVRVDVPLAGDAA